MIRLAYIIIIIVAGSYLATAQKGHELGGWLGTSLYYGDLNPSINIADPGLAGGLLAKYNYNSRVSLRAGLSYANVSASDADSDNNFQRSRNLSFKSTIWDMTAGVEFNFFPLVHSSTDQLYTPYLFGGFNVFRYNPKAELDGVTYELSPLGTEGQDIGEEYFLISGGLVLGGGFKWAIGNDVYVSVEASARLLFTDYLDDVSTTYPDLQRLQVVRGTEAVALSDRSIIDGIGEAGRQRGNSKDNDRIAFVGISVMKYFGRLECPKISKIY